ncbi:isoleucine--tRNA ligase [Candidatus Poribacteria bacterium]|nr:isoleucine--tRNA ligase [Candidatus Poribacteria bacterium]MBT5536286.1 isoleucine--tRNA ligase [Candidatus Poribacteria bacterium]
MGDRFQPVNTRLDFPELERGVLDLWRETDMFRKSIEARDGCKPFVFLEGPPTANGKPGVHHVLARVMKDVICRYKTMTGHQVHRKGGWDTHGLPVEIEVEKALGLDGKEEIEAYGIREFVEKCKESVLAYEQDWQKITERIGFWVDMDDPYVTFHNDYIESVWSVLKRYWDAGLLYQGHKVVPYCPRCGTALSSHEVAQGYAEVEDPSVYVKFRLKDEPNTYFLVWTTTPWTLPSNVALAVKADAEYARVRHGDETWIVAKALVEKVLSEHTGYRAADDVMGSDLVGTDYEPLFDFANPREKAYYVVAADFVTLDDGTGIVHLAPAFGQDDYDVGREHGLPVVQLVNTEGAFVDAVEPWAGVFVKDADAGIIDNLQSRGQMLRSETMKHDYPFCWRCDTALLYYARASWFVRTTAFKDRMVELNRTVNWHPGHIKEGRFGDWLENNIDWAVSRERYWGTPLPIWRCVECDHTRCIGGVDELKAAAPNTPDDIELHRPYIDEVEMPCDECGGVMKRVPEVADAWLDSGCAHTAQWHAPFENADEAARAYPADFISEAIDQTRGWFYSLLATGAFLYDEVAYRNCLCLELVMGADGLKMSKTRGNMVDPWAVLDKHGADATRWYFYTVAPPWQQRVFSDETVGESLKKFLGTLYNVYGFFVLYANADDIDPTVDVPAPVDRPLMDRWVLSRYNSLARTVRAQMDDYQITQAARAIEAFADELSNWYVRRGRNRFWGSSDAADTRAAFATLYEVLVGVSKLLAPFAPFVSEAMYQNLVKSVDADAAAGVHVEDFPTADESLVDVDLETAMVLTRGIVTMGRAARNDSKIRTRQPLSWIVVGGLGPVAQAQVGARDDLHDAIVGELNVKGIDWADDLSDYASYGAKANFRTLGQKFGKDVQAIAKAVAAADGEALQAALRSDGEASVSTDVGTFTIDASDVEVSLQSRDGYAVVTDGGVFVALDTEITPELAREGLARELVNRIQAMRKEADFHVADRIALSVAGDADVSAALEAHRDYVLGETLATELVDSPVEGAFAKDVKVGAGAATISVRQVAS